VRRGLSCIVCCLLLVIGSSYCEELSDSSETPILDCALALARKIPAAYRPDPRVPYSRPVLLCKLAGHYARAGQKEKTDECFSEAKKLAADLPGGGGVWDAGAGQLLSAGSYDYAFEAVKLLGDINVKMLLLFRLGQKALERGDVEQAREIADALSAEGRGMDGRKAALVTSECARIRAAVGDKEAANKGFRQALEHLKTAGYPEDLFYTTVADYAKGCPYEDVLTSLKRVCDNSHLARSLQKVGETHWNEGNRDVAKRAFEDAMAAAAQIKDTSESAMVHATLAQSNAVLGRAEDALRELATLAGLLDVISDAKLKNRIWKAIAITRAELGQLEEARAAARSVSDTYQLSEALVAVSCRLAQAGQFQRAITEMARVPKAFLKDKGLARLAGIFAASGHLEEALELIGEIKLAAYRTTGLLGMVRSLSDGGDYERAVQVLALVTSSVGVKTKAASELAGRCVEAAKGQSLSGNLSVAVRAVGIMDSARLKWEAMMRISEAYEGAGLAEEALGVQKEALAAIAHLEPESERRYPTALVLSESARIYAATGRGERAREIVRKVIEVIESAPEPAVKESWLEGVLKELVDEGRLCGLASELLEGVSGASCKAKGYWHLAACHAAFDRPDQARAAMQKGLQWVNKVEGLLKRVNVLINAAETRRKWRVEVAQLGREMLRRIVASAAPESP